MCRYTTLWKRSKLLLSVRCTHEQRSASLSWFWSAYRSWALQTWSSLIQEQRWMFLSQQLCQWCWRVSRVVHFSTGQRSCTPGTWHCATSQASNICFIPTGSVAAKQSRPQSSWLQDMERRPAASVSVMGVQHWWTQAAFGARLARHWPDHHWQCSWRVA